MLRNIWLTAMAYTGAILGAGFASGQELWQFFGVYGLWGAWALLGVGLGFGFFGYAILWLSKRNHCENQQGFLRVVFPSCLVKPADWLLNGFMFGVLAIMLAAAGALGAEVWGLPKFVGIGFLWLLLYWALGFPLEGFLRLQSFLITPLIFLVVFVGVLGLKKIQAPGLVIEAQLGPFRPGLLFFCFKSAMLYLGYNLLSGVAALVSIDKRALPLGAVVGGVILGGLGCLLVVVLVLGYGEGVIPFGSPLPLLSLAVKIGKPFLYIYGIIMAIAVFTTGVTSAFVLECRFSLLPRNRARLLLLLLVLPFGFLEFGFLVGKVYGFFGVLGLLLLAGIGIACLKGLKALW